MKLGIVSDCHANLEAMESVWAALDREKPDAVVCLGDMVGYNADPGPVLDQVRKRCKVVLAGNHERYQFGTVPDIARDEAKESAEYTRKNLSAEQNQYIRGLPTHHLLDMSLLLVHGSVRDPDEYIRSTESMVGNLKRMAKEWLGVNLCFYGHTHLPMVITQGRIEGKFEGERNEVKLERGKTHLINVGSVGQPRDGVALAAFGVFDSDAYAVTVHRVAYDVDGAMDKVRKAGLPPFLADRLKVGR